MSLSQKDHPENARRRIRLVKPRQTQTLRSKMLLLHTSHVYLDCQRMSRTNTRAIELMAMRLDDRVCAGT
jgi:hypothetical protein